MREARLNITKGGKLIETKWVFDEEKDVGAYQEFDRTDTAVSRLFECCGLADDVTLRDVFLLINTEPNLFDLVLGNWCMEIVGEGLNNPPGPTEDVTSLELYKLVTKDEDGLNGLSFANFHGLGENEDNIPYCVSYTPANEIIDLPLKINEKLIIYEDDSNSPDFGKEIISFDNAEYTLGDILYGIIWELSWNGSPQDRDAQRRELDERTEEAEELIESERDGKEERETKE